jgi:hypothetical protein
MGMTRRTPLLALGAAALLGGTTASAAILSDDFSTNTLANYTNPSGGRLAFTYDAINERVSVADNPHAMAHNTTIGPISQGPLTFRVDFLTNAELTNSTTINAAGTGFATSAASWDGTYTGFEAMVRGGTADFLVRIRPNGGSAGQLLGTAVALTADTWYTLELTVAHSSGNNFAVAGRLLQGGVEVAGSSVGGTVENSALAAALNADLFAGISGRRVGGSGGVVALDNLSVIPEPASLALLGLGGLLALGRRRQA